MVLFAARRLYGGITRYLCSTPKRDIMKYLCVAEKNDAAKNIAAILSRGNSNRREGYSPYNKIYEFHCNVRGNDSLVAMTSVSGHLLTHEFSTAYKGWRSCNPVELFDAPVHKYCPEDYLKVKRTLELEIRDSHCLVIWTDCDREGENIGFEIIKVCTDVRRNLKVYRAKFSEITHASIWRAIQNLGEPNKHVSDAVDVRSEMDLRTGAAFTRLQTLRLQKVFPNVLEQKLISYGSCQFPTLGFVVERYQAIENFIPEPFWKINMSHALKNLTTHFVWTRHRLFDKNAVLALLDMCLLGGVARIESVESKPKSKWRPVPLDTVEMEKIISRKMRINAKEVMKIAEKLYTQGYISYPRTETNIFPKEMNLSTLVEHQNHDPNWGAFAMKVMNEGGPNPRQGKKSDQAHPPIHPIKYVGTLNGNEKKVYEYIVRHFLACVSKDAKGHETIVQADVGDEKFTAKGLVVLERNYLEVYIYENWQGKEINEYQVGDTFTPTNLEMVEGFTAPPKLLTEADLIALMEKHGIGTDATHAEHIETIKTRGYVTIHQNMYFVPAALGMGLVEGYNNMNLQISLAKPNLRSEFESDLKLICEGRKRADDVLQDQINKYREVFRTVASNMLVIDNTLADRLNDRPQTFDDNEFSRSERKPVLKCPKCGKNMVIRQRANGNYFLGCLNYPDCKNAGWFPSGINTIDVTDDSCTQCGPNVKKLKIKFIQNPFLGEPNPIVLCVGGCDAAVLSVLDVPISVVKKLNQPAPSQSTTRNDNSHQTSTSSTYTNASSNSTSSSSANTRRKSAKPPQKSTLTSWVGASGSASTSTFQPTPQPPQQRGNTQPHNFQPYNNTPISNTISDDAQVCNCQKQAVLLTCRKGPNSGRQFYKCPDSTATGGGCNYFLWHNNDDQNDMNNDNNTSQSQQAMGGGDNDEARCNCNTPTVSRTVSKEGPNKGRKFKVCSKPMGTGCSFFAWEDEDGGNSSFNITRTRGRKPNWNKRRRTGNDSSRRGTGAKRSKRKCGICGQEGHTRSTCPNNEGD